MADQEAALPSAPQPGVDLEFKRRLQTLFLQIIEVLPTLHNVNREEMLNETVQLSRLMDQAAITWPEIDDFQDKADLAHAEVSARLQGLLPPPVPETTAEKRGADSMSSPAAAPEAKKTKTDDAKATANEDPIEHLPSSPGLSYRKGKATEDDNTPPTSGSEATRTTATQRDFMRRGANASPFKLGSSSK